MQYSSHLTIILCSSVIKIVISQKQKVNRKNNYYYYSCFLKNNNKTLQNKFVTSPRLCNKYFLFMFFKIAPENFQTHT
jgi:hypothetical protein